MLIVPDHDPIYRIMAIDPGSSTLGVAILDVNLIECKVVVVEAFTVNAGRLFLRYPQIVHMHGERTARLYAIQESLFKIMTERQPHCVINESPYMGRFPQAYAALIECVSSVRRAVMQYDPGMQLESIDPMSAKQAVGVSKKGSTKEDVALGTQNVVGMSFAPEIDVSLLDEHSTDAVAVGYYKYRQLIGV